MAQGDRTHEGRLSALEQGYENLRGEIHGLRTDVRGFMSEMRNEVGTSRRVQWSPIFAGVAVIIGILGAFAAGPLSQLQRLEDQQHVMAGNRFTDRDGDNLANLMRNGFNLQQGQLDKMWDRIEGVEDEDFKRPEAEQMRGQIMEEVQWLRDFVVNHQCAKVCPLKDNGN